MSKAVWYLMRKRGNTLPGGRRHIKCTWHLCKQQRCRHKGCNVHRQENISMAGSCENNRLQNKTEQDPVFMKKRNLKTHVHINMHLNAESRRTGTSPQPQIIRP